MLDKKELTLILDDFKQIFHLPQATTNNHNSFVPPPSFSDMVPFYKQVLGFTIELKRQSKTTGILQPWQTLCKIFSKCLTTRVTGWDQLPLQIMQMLYCFVNNIHVDYAELLWEGLYYSLHHPTYSILKHKNISCNEDTDWMITEEMEATEHYQNVYGRSLTPDNEVAESSAPRRSTVIRLRLPKRRSTRLTPPAPVPTVDKADEMNFTRTLTKQKNIVDDSSIPRNDESNIPGTRIEPRSDKESPEVEIAKEKEVEITQETEVEITNVIIPVNVTDEDEEITDEVYELKKESELTDTPHTTSSSSLPHKKLTKTNRLLSLFKTKPTRFKRYKSFFHELQGRYGYLFAHLRERFMPRKSFDTLADNLHDVMVESLPDIVDKHVKKQVMQQVPEQVRNQVPVYVAEGLILERKKAKEETERLIAKAILQERGNIQAQISTQIENAIANVIPSQVDASVRNYMSGHILHTDSYASDDDEIPMKQVSQDFMEEVSLTIDEAKLRKMADEMLRQRCTSGDEH
ncbi:hypothetical protein Tco_0320325 [Tanacetum coccineum]